MDRLYAERMADLVLRKGVSLRKGEKLLLSVGPESYEYAKVMAEHAYELGAAYVEVMLSDTRVNIARVMNQDGEALEYVPAYRKALYDQIASESGWVRVRIDSGEERIDLPAFDTAKMQLLQSADRKAAKEMSTLFMRDKAAWCVTCAPGPKWAKRILGEDKSEADLAAVLSRIMRIDTENYLECWDEFAETSRKRREKLTGLCIKRLHYKSPVTDLYIGFRREAHWDGATSPLPDGRLFFPNLPTEEIFTTPDMYETEGYVTTTRPVSVMGLVTEQVRLTFKAGVVTDCTAVKGQEVMETYLSIDEGCRRLGEAALVDVSSPISESGLIFDSILIDENASCHIALGAGYPNCIAGSEECTTDEELNKIGINTSLMHTDFMIGSAELDIEAECYDGRSVSIMKKGHFTF